MVIEAIIGGITVIFVSSLVFANSLIKKQREWDLEDEKEPPPPPEPEPEPTIAPFIEFHIGTRCPKCKREGKNAIPGKSGAEGVMVPMACSNPGSCPARKHSHLHVQCNTCLMKWFMATADASKPAPSETNNSASS